MAFGEQLRRARTSRRRRLEATIAAIKHTAGVDREPLDLSHNLDHGLAGAARTGKAINDVAEIRREIDASIVRDDFRRPKVRRKLGDAGTVGSRGAEHSAHDARL